MKITVPKDTIAVGNETVDFAWFVRFMADADQRFQANANGLRAKARIKAALAVANGAMVVDDADGALLQQVVEQPSNGYPTMQDLQGRVVRHLGEDCLPFIDAIAEAKPHVEPAGA